MIQGLFLLIIITCFICGIVFITINLTRLNTPAPKTQIIYRYMPKTFEQEQNEQPFVSEIFKTLFTDQTPWVNSIMDYDRRKQEAINKYYISQI
jgi:hypothetical protein